MKITLPEGLSAEDALAQFAPKIAPSPLDETMASAFPTGVRVELDSRKEAEALRFRFYRRIKELKRAGIHTFAELSFTIEGQALFIKPLPDLNARTSSL